LGVMVLAASKEGEKDYGSPLVKAASRRKKATSRKVIDFFEEQARRKKASLSDQEKDDLVIEFRLKARKLARSILRKWHARLDLQEVDSIVDLSLCEAVRRFDPTKGASFMTFLYYHLRGNLIRIVSSAASASGYVGAEEGEDGETNTKYSARAVNAVEVAAALSGSEVATPDEILFKKELISLSKDACKNLDTLERQVIERLFLGEEQLMDIAHSLGYSRCHISRVKKKALEALQAEMRQIFGNNLEQLDGQAKRKAIHRRRPRSAKARQVRRKSEQVQDKLAAVG